MQTITRNHKTGKFQSIGDPKPNVISVSDQELLLLDKLRALKQQFPTFPAPDGSYEQDLFFVVKAEGMITDTGPCQGKKCKHQAKFFLLAEKVAYCESCLEKKEYFRV
jgi:hypothetical protein